MKNIYLSSVVCGLALVGVAGCHSYHVEATVENRTGQELKQLEVAYPSATFGADKMAPGAVLHYRMQFIGSGQMKVHYWTGTGQLQETVIPGPELHEQQEGRIGIVLEPGGKADFTPEVTP
jgi:hypothetical protein